VSRDVNTTEVFTTIFNSIRNIEEKVIDTNGQEMFFYLDEDVKPGSNYTYQISTGKPTGNPNPNKKTSLDHLYLLLFLQCFLLN